MAPKAVREKKRLLLVDPVCSRMMSTFLWNLLGRVWFSAITQDIRRISPFTVILCPGNLPISPQQQANTCRSLVYPISNIRTRWSGPKTPGHCGEAVPEKHLCEWCLSTKTTLFNPNARLTQLSSSFRIPNSTTFHTHLTWLPLCPTRQSPETQTHNTKIQPG